MFKQCHPSSWQLTRHLRVVEQTFLPGVCRLLCKRKCVLDHRADKISLKALVDPEYLSHCRTKLIFTKKTETRKCLETKQAAQFPVTHRGEETTAHQRSPETDGAESNSAHSSQEETHYFCNHHIIIMERKLWGQIRLVLDMYRWALAK